MPHLKLIMSREKPKYRNGMASPFSQLHRRELPSKTIAKNIEQIITYPHSDSKRFEKRQSLEAR